MHIVSDYYAICICYVHLYWYLLSLQYQLKLMYCLWWDIVVCCFWVDHCLKEFIQYNFTSTHILWSFFVYKTFSSFWLSSLFKKTCSFLIVLFCWLFFINFINHLNSSFMISLTYLLLLALTCHSEYRFDLYWLYFSWSWLSIALTLCKNSESK